MNMKRISYILVLFALFVVPLYLDTMPAQAVSQDDQADTITIMAWSPDNTRVAVGTDTGNVAILDANTGKVLQSIATQQLQVTGLAWRPDGREIANTSLPGNPQIWDVASGKQITTFASHEAFTLLWSSDGKHLFTGSVEDLPNLRVWDVASGKILHAQDTGTVVQLALSPDQSRLASILAVGEVQIWDATTLTPQLTIQQPEGFSQDFSGTSVAWSPDGTQVVSGTRNGAVRIWDAKTGKMLADLKANDASQPDWKVTSVDSLSFSFDGEQLISITADGTLRAWDAQNGKVLGTMHTQAHPYGKGAAWSVYGGQLALGGELLAKTNSSVQTQSVAGTSNLQILVPFPTSDKLQGIAKRCASASIQDSLRTRIAAKQFSAFANDIRSMSKDQLPPACAADLISVANALQSAAQ